MNVLVAGWFCWGTQVTGLDRSDAAGFFVCVLSDMWIVFVSFAGYIVVRIGWDQVWNGSAWGKGRTGADTGN